MKTFPKRSWLAISLAATTPWAALVAQDSDDDEVFELSPFTVDASQDDGYRANSTTAGSRLNTELKDVAASVTVLTDAFMDDLGTDDLDDVLSMVAGVETHLTTETQGPHLSQGFVGGDFGDPNAQVSTVRVRGLGRATQSANYIEVRGPIDRYNMERTEFLRGPNALLFGLGLPGGVVNYTTKKASLNREINKFEIKIDNFGSRRGMIDVSRPLIEDKLAVRLVAAHSDQRYMSETAQYQDDKVYFTTTYKPFKNTKIDGYYERTFADGRRPNYRIPQDNVSQYLKYWNEAHQTYSGQALEDHLNDNFYWDGSWSYTSAGAAPRSPDYEFTERHRVDGDGNPLTFNPEFRDRLDGRDKALTGFYSEDNWYVPQTPEGGYTTLYGAWRTTLNDPANGRGANANRRAQPRARLRIHRSGDPYDSKDRAYVDTQVTDENIFPIFDYEMSTLPGNFRKSESRKIGFNLDHKFNEDLYFSASYMKEKYDEAQNFGPLAQTQAISLDINRYLPGAIQDPGLFYGAPYINDLRNADGTTSPLVGGGSVQITLDTAIEQANAINAHLANGGQLRERFQDENLPQARLDEIMANNQMFLQQASNRVENPNFLRPFVHGRSIGGVKDFGSEAALAQVNYDFDFSEKSDRLGFLGFHRLTAFGSVSKKDELSWRHSNGAVYNPDIARNGTGAQESSRRLFWPIFYVGDSVKPGDTGLNITSMPATTTPYLENQVGHRYYTNENSDRGEWLVNQEGLDIRPLIIGRTRDFSGIDAEGWGASLQSFFWNRRIVTTVGLREDTVASIDYALSEDSTEAWDFVDDGSKRTDWLTDQPILVFEDTAQLISKSAVFHATNWLRFFYNESENFDLTSPSVDGFNNPIPAQGGNTKEYGLGLRLFENKLDLRLNLYETSQVYQPIGNLTMAGRMRSFENRFRSLMETMDQRVLDGDPAPYDITDWERVLGRSADGTLITDNPGIREQAVDEETGAPLTNEDGSPQWSYPDEDVEWVPANNVGITQDSVSEGWELTGTYNPTRNFRLRGSISRLENSITNKHLQTLDYIQARAPYWNQFISQGFHTNGDNDATVYWEEEDPSIPEVLPYNHRVLQTGSQEPDTGSLLAAQFYGPLGSELLTALADEGTSSVGISEYNARITANYSFHEGRLKGFSFGTNLRYESGKALGYELITVPDSELPAGFPHTDLNGNGQTDENEFLVQRRDSENPILGPSHITGGVMFNYRRKIQNDKVDWRVQLNVDNLFKQGDDFRIIRFNPDGSPIFGLNRPTTFKLTNTLSW